MTDIVLLEAKILCDCFNLFWFISITEPMCVTSAVSLLPRCYEADVIPHSLENQYVCDRCCVTRGLDVIWLIT